MSKGMRKAVIIVLICAVVWLIAGAVLVPVPESVRDWAAYGLMALGWMAVGFAFGGIGGYNTAHEEDKPKPTED